MGDRAIDPRVLSQVSQRQIAERDQWNARSSRFNRVPKQFDPGAEIDWSPVWSLTRQDYRYLPTGFCYYAYPEPPDQAFLLADSNGNAAGNTLEEAVLQGFLELVERDAMGVWWYNRIRRPAVDIDSFDDPYPQRLRDYLAGHGRDLWVLDITNDLRIPVFGAFSRRVEGEHERIIMGFGSHLDPAIALRRALTEMNQMLTWVLPKEIGASREDELSDQETVNWLATAFLATDPHLAPDPDLKPRCAQDLTSNVTSDLRDDIEFCRGVVEAKGHEFLVLDQTRPDIGLSVAKVIVPGLAHCHARFGCPRLYQAPVDLGWRASPLTEAELNPVPIFL